MPKIEVFAFQTPLYSKIEINPTDGGVTEDLIFKAQLLAVHPVNIDGHCPYCQKTATFAGGNNTRYNLGRGSTGRHEVIQAVGFKSTRLYCTRDESHTLHFWFILAKDSVEKVGQYPSLADIANDEARTYRSILDKQDAAELHKAIGLAAHGVGIGSFVYLRRVFERLIYGRFEEFKEKEGWSEEDFSKLRMDEKVKFLKGHIPEFLYENKRLYGILSKGIHELGEEVCLKAFEYLKLSIKIILEEDKKKKEDLALKELAAKSIQDFEH